MAQKLGELAQTEGWAILRETFERQKAGYYQKLSRSLMRGWEFDQRKLDYNRGFFDSVEQLLSAPTNAERLLKRSVERLRAKEGNSE